MGKASLSLFSRLADATRDGEFTTFTANGTVALRA